MERILLPLDQNCSFGRRERNRIIIYYFQNRTRACCFSAFSRSVRKHWEASSPTREGRCSCYLWIFEGFQALLLRDCFRREDFMSGNICFIFKYVVPQAVRCRMASCTGNTGAENQSHEGKCKTQTHHLCLLVCTGLV